MGLLDFAEATGQDWSDQVVTAAIDRFERRLTEEASILRVEIARLDVRLEQGLSGIRQEVAINRVELLKWSFLFWVGQIAAMTALLAFTLKR